MEPSTEMLKGILEGCVLELIGIGLIFNLDKKTTNQMYAELAQRRAQAAETQE